MTTQNGVVGSASFTEKQIVDASAHPPIIEAVELAASQGTLARGQFLARDANGKCIPYTTENNDFAGVLTEAVDTTVNTLGLALEHGCYVLAKCLVAAAVPAAADIAEAKAKGCWAR